MLSWSEDSVERCSRGCRKSKNGWITPLVYIVVGDFNYHAYHDCHDYLWHHYPARLRKSRHKWRKKQRALKDVVFFFQRTKAQRILSMSRNLVTDTITYLLLGASKGRGWTREESENSWNFWMLEDGMEIIELFLLIQNSFMIWSVLVNIMWWLLVLVDGSWKKLANESRFAAVTNVLDGVCYWPENYQKQSLNGLGCKKRHHTPFQPLQLTFFWWEIYIDKVYTIDHYSDQCLIHDQLQQYGPNPWDDWKPRMSFRLGPSDLKDTDVSWLPQIDLRGSSDALQWFFPTSQQKQENRMAVTFIAQELNLNHLIFFMSVFGGVTWKWLVLVRCTHKSCKKFVRSVFLDDWWDTDTWCNNMHVYSVPRCIQSIFFIDSLTCWICMSCDKRGKGTQDREKRLSQYMYL